MWLSACNGLMMRSGSKKDCDEGETTGAWRQMTDDSVHSTSQFEMNISYGSMSPGSTLYLPVRSAETDNQHCGMCG